MTKKTHELVRQMLSEARDDVKHADQKASVILAALGIGFGAVLGGQFAGSFDLDDFSCAGKAIWWVGSSGAALSVALAALAVWPRYTLDDRPEHGITYWGHIAAFRTLDEFKNALDGQSVSAANRTSHQLWRLSKLVLLKYQFIRAALVCAGGAAILLALATTISVE